MFAPLTQLLIDLYTWRGAVLIIGALMFNIIACGLLFRPLGDARRTPRSDISASGSSSVIVRPGTPVSCQCQPASDALMSEPDGDHELTHSLLTFPTYLQSDLDAVACDLPKGVNDRALCDILKEHHRQEEESRSDIAPLGGAIRANGDSRRVTMPHPRKHSKRGIGSKPGDSVQHSLPMGRKDVFYRGSLLNTGSIGCSNGKWVSCPNIVVHSARVEAGHHEKDTSPRRRGLLNALRISREAKHVLSEMLDTSMLRSRVFLLFCVSNMLLYAAYDVPYVYTPDKALHMGISSQRASFLVSVIGIASTVGQVAIGYLGDKPYINALLLYNAFTSVAGVGTMAVPLFTSYMALTIYCGVFGFFISANYALTTIILVNLFGMDRLTNAYGIVMLAEGVANVIGPPLAGKAVEVVHVCWVL